MDVWLVSMGIGENVSERKPRRIFKTKDAAFIWVMNHFKEDAEMLRQNIGSQGGYDNGVTIGNSFAIRKEEVEDGNP